MEFIYINEVVMWFITYCYYYYLLLLLLLYYLLFAPLVFTTTGGMGRECYGYHSRLAKLISAEKGEDYAKTWTWIRGKVSFSILRSAPLCLRGSRSIKGEQ